MAYHGRVGEEGQVVQGRMKRNASANLNVALGDVGVPHECGLASRVETLERVYLDFLSPSFLINWFPCKYIFLVTLTGGSHGGSRGGRRVQQPDGGWVREPRRVSVPVVPPHFLHAVVLLLCWRSRLVHHSLFCPGHLRLRSFHGFSEFSIGLMCAFALCLVFSSCFFNFSLLIVPMGNSKVIFFLVGYANFLVEEFR